MTSESTSFSLTLDISNLTLSNLVGPMENNLRQIEMIQGVKISRRGTVFKIEGKKNDIEATTRALEKLAKQSENEKREISEKDVQLHFVGERFRNQVNPQTEISNIATGRGKTVQPRTVRQAEYIEAAQKNDISFGIGPAGTGKTYLAVACAVQDLERDRVERIILTRPAVEAGERLGFLPGDLSQKVDPYLRPLYDALFDLLGFEKTQRLLEKQAIEIAPLAYMRGRTLNNAFVILDEAQNTTIEQMKMFLTRIGFGSRAMITGDITQIDLPKGVNSGLINAQHVLKSVRGIHFTYFTAADVVRHPLVARIVNAYAKEEKNRE